MGARVAARWRLPEPVRAAIARHHSPGGEAPVPEADLVHVADVLCRGLEIGNGDDLIPALDGTVLTRLGLTCEIVVGALPEIERMAADADDLLGA